MSIDAASVIRRESERLAAALADIDPDRPVPSCPGWTAADLLWHLTEVHEFWSAILSQGATTQEQVQRIDEGKTPRPEDPAALAPRRLAATEALLEALASRRDEEQAWFWYDALQTVGVTRRMQTHEATIHRVDAELTAQGAVTPILPEVALAGIDHVVDVMWPDVFEWIPDWATLTPVATLEIAPQEGPARELVISRWSGTRPRDGQVFDAPVARTPALEPAGTRPAELPRARADGSAMALDLWAWGRAAALGSVPGPLRPVELTGDPAALEQVEGLLAEGHD